VLLLGENLIVSLLELKFELHDELACLKLLSILLQVLDQLLCLFGLPVLGANVQVQLNLP